jgi:hypothetical protein
MMTKQEEIAALEKKLVKLKGLADYHHPRHAVKMPFCGYIFEEATKDIRKVERQLAALRGDS